MEHSKKAILADLSAGMLDEAAAAALAYAEFVGVHEIINGLVALNNRRQVLDEDWRAGVLTYDQVSIHHAQILQALIAWIDRLPDQPVAAKRRRKPLKESTFKNRVFYLLCAIKLIVILRLAYHWSTGGFNNDQFQATVTLLIPAMAAYITVMIEYYIQQQQNGPETPRYLSGPLVTFSYWLFPIYALLLIYFIELKASSQFTFAQMNFWLALVECVLGGYIGRIVFAFFKKG